MAYIDEITPEMCKTVDSLKARNFADATPEEIETYANWSRLIAMHDEDLRAKTEIRQRESEERRQLNRQQAQSAINALDTLAELAQAKLKAVENESQEQTA